MLDISVYANSKSEAKTMALSELKKAGYTLVKEKTFTVMSEPSKGTFQIEKQKTQPDFVKEYVVEYPLSSTINIDGMHNPAARFKSYSEAEKFAKLMAVKSGRVISIRLRYRLVTTDDLVSTVCASPEKLGKYAFTILCKKSV